MIQRNMIALGCACVVILSGCGEASPPLAASDKANIDCLASKTVMDIATAVRTGLENGANAESLSGVQAEFTESGAKRLAEYYTNAAYETYYRAETERRLTAMQNALANRNSDSADQLTLDETMNLAQTCRFEAI